MTSLRPVDAYKTIIDQLANETASSGMRTRIVEGGYFPDTSAGAVFNELLASLSSAQRKLLGDLLLEERSGAIHDVLSVLTWWIISRGLAFTFQGEPMPVDLSGMGLHGDFVGRRQGWEWPHDAPTDA